MELFVKKFSGDKIRNNFPAYIRRVWLKKFLIYQELVRQIREVKGDIVELGVYRGLSLLSFAHLNEYYSKDKKRTIYGVDTFQGFPEIGPKDQAPYDLNIKHANGLSAVQYLDETRGLVNNFNKQAKNTKIELVVGNIEQAAPLLAKKKIRLAMLHFDADLYVPTKIGLQYLYPRLSKGGVAVFDEYANSEWGGETRAVDEYFKNRKEVVRKFAWHAAPTAYIVK